MDWRDYIARNLNRRRLQSNKGTGAIDITVDFKVTDDPNTYTVIMYAAQNQDAGVALNVGAFLCPPDFNYISGPGTDNSKLLDAAGGINPELLGPLVAQEGSTTRNWGPMFTTFAGSLPIGLVIPPGWFVRFTTFLGASLGFPAANSTFRIELAYYVRPICGEQE